MSIPISSDDQNVVFSNVSNERRQFIIEGNDVRFITGIRGAAEWDDCCIGISIKWNTHHSQLDFLNAIKWF